MQRIDKNEIIISNIQVLATAGSSYSGGVMVGTPSEDSAFVKENIIDLHPKKVAKALVADALFSVNINDADTNAVAIFNTNASAATIEVLDENGDVWYTESISLKGAMTYRQFITNRNIPTVNDLYITYPLYGLSHIVNIYLSGPLTDPTVSVGVVFVGQEKVTTEPLYGFTQSSKDYSIVAETAVGATYILNRRIVRTFSSQLDMCDGGDPQALIDTFLSIKSEPIPWILVTREGVRFMVFARKSSELTSNFYAFGRVIQNINLIEVL